MPSKRALGRERSSRRPSQVALHEREGAAITNFQQALEADDAEAVQRITRDPVVLDFVQLTDGAKERDLEAALLEDIERFMLALGEGFYFAGRQKSLEIGGEEASRTRWRGCGVWG